MLRFIDLLDEGRGGDGHAMDELFAELSRWLRTELLRRHAFSAISDADREDLAQEVLLSLLRDLPRFRGDTDDALRSWVWTIAVRTKKRLSPPCGGGGNIIGLDETLVCSYPPPSDPPEDDDPVLVVPLSVARELKSAGLTRKARRLWVIRHRHPEATWRDVAASLGSSRAAVRKALQRAEARIRHHRTNAPPAP